MGRVKGKIFAGNSLLFDGLEVWVEVEPSGTFKIWPGQFSLPSDHQISPGKSYRLVADDGREGSVVIQPVTSGSHQDTRVFFGGVGAFE